MSAGTRLAWVVPCVDGSGLARVVALVDVDDAMVERFTAALWPSLATLPEARQRMAITRVRAALAAAISPPEA